MASTTALYTGLSGLNAYSRSLEVIGNNIANVNTTAFKSSRANFQDAFYRTLSPGTEPRDASGGTDPYQIGMGVSISGTQRDFRQGTISATGNPNDLAIDGAGFFIVSNGADPFYTRAGDFALDANQALVNPAGLTLQGYAADEGFNITVGTLSDLTIPIGAMTLAEATHNTSFRGNLNAAGDVPTRGALVNLRGTETGGLGLIAGATVPPGPGNVLESSSLLTEIETPDDPGSGTPLFAAGQSVELRNATKGGATVPTAQFAIGGASTVQDLMDFLVGALGIQTTGSPNPDGRAPGATLDPQTGIVSITGNTGTINDLDLADAINQLDAGGALLGRPFYHEKAATADGESVRTTFLAYDSLGAPLTVNLGMVLDSKADTGTTWRYYVDSADDTDPGLAVATGTLEFDNFGGLVTTTPVPIQIHHDGTGAATPQEINLSFADSASRVTALADETSAIAASSSDGSPIGTLQSFSIQADGTIMGGFSNSILRPLGRLAVADFNNAPGLIDLGSNTFKTGPDSGDAMVNPPGVLGNGTISAGSLELSNVDLGAEFTKMILASTGYSASSRVMRTADELLQQLMVLGR
jgi:flagellar hook protein FlgE